MLKRPWKSFEEEYVRENYQKKTVEFISNMLGRSKSSVVWKAAQLGVQREPPREWTDYEKNYLINYWGFKDLDKIAGVLDRSIKGVHDKGISLGLGGFCRRGYTLNHVARITGYCPKSLKARFKSLGIPLRRMPRFLSGDSKNRCFCVKEDQLQVLIDAIKRDDPLLQLRSKDWGTGGKPDNCLRCGSSNKEHYARGYCSACYVWIRRHG